jgi:micrococcal nuclease
MPRHRRYHKRHLLSLLLFMVVLLFLGYAGHRHWLQHVNQAAVSNQPGTYSINHFIDGDTIAVNMNGSVEKVRFIGVDTPETHKPNTPVQCFGPQAAAHTKQMIGHNRVRLVADPLSTDRDRYGRLLRYVYLSDGTNLDQFNIQEGYGFYYPYFPFSKADQFAAAEQAAIAGHKGLWGHCKPTATDEGGYVSNPQTN